METHIECSFCIYYIHSHTMALPSLRDAINTGFFVGELRPTWFL